jgi:ribonuclease P protein component
VGASEARVKRCFRLTRSSDIKRVRRSGRSYAHPLVVLYVVKADFPTMHVGVSAGLAVGNAVKRNRAKRLIRAAMNELIPQITTGADLLLIARAPLAVADVRQTHEALIILLKRAGLLSPAHDV